jgi:uncharacterized protein (TIGR00730 family)
MFDSISIDNRRGESMNICVYGASSNTIDIDFVEKVESLGEEIAKRGHNLVYGGGAQGLMGAIARGAIKADGKVKGIAPSFFNVDGVLFEDCTEFIYTETMRERKQLLEDHSDCFIVAPGGIGTFEEFFEVLTLKQLRRHEKAIVIYNINAYYDEMEKMIENAINEGFMKESCRELYTYFDDMDKMLDYLEEYVPEKAEPCKYKNV